MQFFLKLLHFFTNIVKDIKRQIAENESNLISSSLSRLHYVHICVSCKLFLFKHSGENAYKIKTEGEMIVILKSLDCAYVSLFTVHYYI